VDAEGWNLRYAEAESPFADAVNPLVVDGLADLPPGRALDLAAGQGRHALWLARRGWRVTAVDFSAVGVERGMRDTAAEGLPVEWVVEDVYRYEMPENAFDLVLIAYFHPDPGEEQRVYADAVDALVPGGRLLVLGRHVADIGRDGGRGPRDAAYRYTPEGLAGVLPANLALERCESVSRTVTTQRGPLELTDVVAVGTRRPGTSGAAG
jgi:SAM-dependent methyltransferase